MLVNNWSGRLSPCDTKGPVAPKPGDNHVEKNIWRISEAKRISWGASSPLNQGILWSVPLDPHATTHLYRIVRIRIPERGFLCGHETPRHPRFGMSILEPRILTGAWQDLLRHIWRGVHKCSQYARSGVWITNPRGIAPVMMYSSGFPSVSSKPMRLESSTGPTHACTSKVLMTRCRKSRNWRSSVPPPSLSSSSGFRG